MTAYVPSRRSVLKAAGFAAAATVLGPTPDARAADDGTYPRLAWRPPTAPALTVPLSMDANTQRMFPTLMPAGSYLPNALDAWYLWLWTHDTSRTYLYTAPSPTGPFTPRGFGAAPVDYPAGYLSGHFSSGDIVWDPQGQRLVSSPHGLRLGTVPGNGEASQDSFLTTSTDGLTWSWLDGDNRPRLVCGAPGSPDSVHTGYGRLLRDLDGQLMTANGRYWWMYRAQRRDAPLPNGQKVPTSYTPYLASAGSLSADFTTKQKAFDTLQSSTGLFDVGSFVRAAAAHHVFMVEGTAITFPTYSLYNKTGLDNMSFLPRPVPLALPKPDETVALSGGGNLVRDPVTGEQYLAQIGIRLNPSQSEVWIYRGVEPPT